MAFVRKVFVTKRLVEVAFVLKKFVLVALVKVADGEVKLTA